MPPADQNQQDAIELLKADHRDVEKLFEQFEQTQDENQKVAIAEHICLTLKVHTQIEEEIFYPALRDKIAEKDVDEALVEHQAAKDLIAEIEDVGEVDDMYEARVHVLGEQISHHVKEEEEELFPEAQKAGVDTAGLGPRMAERKAELLRDYESDLAGGGIRSERKSFTGGADLRPDEPDGGPVEGAGKHQDSDARE